MAKRINQTSQHTFTDDPDGALRYALEFEPAFDDSHLANHIEVDAPDGTRGRTGSGVAIDTTSAGDYGTIHRRIQSQSKHGGDRQALAEYRAILYKQPQLRLPEMWLDPARNPDAMWPVVLDLDISDAITVEVFSQTSDPMDLELNVEGIKLSGRPGGPVRAMVKTSPRDTATYMTSDHVTRAASDSGNLAAP